MISSTVGTFSRPSTRSTSRCWLAAGKCPTTASTAIPTHPTGFAQGRYQVKRFLGEGGKKKVYLAHDHLQPRS